MQSVEEIFAKTGRLARRLGNYQLRPQQLQMGKAVARAMADPHHLCVEAGAGIGKSLAYLVPAIERAVRHNDKILISTHTRALQQQLLHTDIPLLNAVTPWEFSAVVVQPRNNYLGLRRLEQSRKRRNLLFGSDNCAVELQRLADWANTTTLGIVDEMSPAPTANVWTSVRSEHGNCMGHRCRHYQACFYHKARRRAQNAQVLIVDHALLCADLALRQHGVSILPDYDVVIIDEAHALARVAQGHFGMSLSRHQLTSWLQSLFDPRNRHGFLSACHAESAVQTVRECLVQVQQVFDCFEHWHRLCARPNGRWTTIPQIDNPLTDLLGTLHADLGHIRSQLTSEDDLFELNSYMDRCRLFGELCSEFLEHYREALVYWLSHDSTQRDLVMNARPIRVADELADQLFGTVPAVVLTSATLSVTDDDRFEYFRRRIGLDEAACLKLEPPTGKIITELMVDVSLPNPNDLENFVPRAAQSVHQQISRLDGSTLVLFSSYKMMQAFRRLLDDKLAQMNCPLYVQGDGLNRARLRAQLGVGTKAVLFGTARFWQQMDIDPQAVTNVVITKLPFDSPSKPLTEATVETIEAGGENAFEAYQLPEAIMRFKQSEGRMLRSMPRRFTVLDSRIRHPRYAMQLLEALPGCRATLTAP